MKAWGVNLIYLKSFLIKLNANRIGINIFVVFRKSFVGASVNTKIQRHNEIIANEKIKTCT